jgi:hypothetical protein
MEKRKEIALVAHDNRKRDLNEWIEYNMISSPLMNEPYRPVTKDYSAYLKRKLPS